MQGTLFNPGERVQRRKVRVRKQRQCVGTQLEFNTDARLNNQLRTIGTLPDYLLEPISAQSERTASRLILKLCRSIRRLWDGNSIEEEQPVAHWKVWFGERSVILPEVGSDGQPLKRARTLDEAMKRYDWTAYNFCSWWHAMAAVTYHEELGSKWERGTK